jgi:hypothetical protein
MAILQLAKDKNPEAKNGQAPAALALQAGNLEIVELIDTAMHRQALKAFITVAAVGRRVTPIAKPFFKTHCLVLCLILILFTARLQF